MAACGRSQSESSDTLDFEDADESDAASPSTAEINKLRNQLKKKYASINDYLLSSKEPVEKRRMIGGAMQDLLSAFNYIAAAYERLNSSCQTVDNLKSTLVMTVRDEISAAISAAKLPTPLPVSACSYANVAARTSKHDGHRVKISNGPTVTIQNTVSFVIGPKKDCSNNFSSADDAKKAAMKAVNPCELNLKVSRVLGTRNNSVRIIAEEVDVEKIRSSPTLSAAGLEVKVKERLNPRLIIRGVPIGTSNEDLLKEIVSMNKSAGCSGENLKIVYRYPPRANNISSSIVIETSSDVRREILKQGRVYLSCQSCKVEDHLRVLQCFNCLAFGHLAKNCSSPQVCGHCSGLHSTSACPNSKIAPTCHNCATAKLNSVDHRAFDAQKCQIIKVKLTEKAKYIAY